MKYIEDSVETFKKEKNENVKVLNLDKESFAKEIQKHNIFQEISEKPKKEGFFDKLIKIFKK